MHEVVNYPDGSGESWDSTDGYRAWGPGNVTTAQRPLTEEETARFAEVEAQPALDVLFTQLQTLIDSVAMISTTAANDSNDAFTRRGQIETWTTAAATHAATIRGIASPTIAQIREELAVACERDVVIAGEIDNFYHWRALVDGLLMLLSQCVAGLARLVTKTPPP